MNKNKIIKIAREYFQTWESQNLIKLEEVLAEDCVLRDWVIEAKGKKAVIEANKTMFDSIRQASVNPLCIFVDGNTAIAELDIRINEGPSELVVDIIEFNEVGQITQLRAYKGN